MKNYFASGWTVAGYLKSSTGPFKDIFIALAGNPTVDFLVVWGLILIGLSLLLGFAIRWASFWGSMMMLLFYLSHLPPEHGPVDDHIIYIGVFAILTNIGAGRYFGVDQYLGNTQFVASNRWLLKLLG